MAENKTTETGASVDAFIDGVKDAVRREDARVVARMMERVSGVAPRMWGPSIVGFGSYHYRYESGRQGDAPRIGFSPRKTSLTLYLAVGDPESAALLERLGKHTTGVGCLYIRRLSEIDPAVLEALVARSWELARERYGEFERPERGVGTGRAS